MLSALLEFEPGLLLPRRLLPPLAPLNLCTRDKGSRNLGGGGEIKLLASVEAGAGVSSVDTTTMSSSKFDPDEFTLQYKVDQKCSCNSLYNIFTLSL